MEKENKQANGGIRAYVLFSQADINSGIVAKLSSAKYGEAAAARDYSGLTMRSDRDAWMTLQESNFEWIFKRPICFILAGGNRSQAILSLFFNYFFYFFKDLHHQDLALNVLKF